jgi:hypothetical protein
MDNDNIFRKAAMERLSSPENLDQVMRVVPAKGWIALVCLFVFAVALTCWACFARITRQAEAQGILARDSAVVIALFADEDARDVRPGMEATFSLNSGAVLAGTVESVLRADDPAFSAKAALIEPKRNEEASVVIIRLNDGEAEDVPRADDAAEGVGTARVTIESIAPIRLVFNRG